ncbi:MAG: hypothetical protein ACYDA2_02820 [Acidimicrobiales bacterium]
MRKFLVGSLVAASLGAPVVTGVLLASPAGADPTCSSSNTALPIPAGTPLGAISVSVPTFPPTTTGTLQVCSEGSAIINGTATASGSGGPSGVSGYAIANGNDTGSPQGYIGVEGGGGPGGGSANVVGCSSGDYNGGNGPNDGHTDANGNNIIVGTPDTVDLATLTGQCSVANEPAP